MSKHRNPKAKVGDKIHIIHMDDGNGKDLHARAYNGREGVVEVIDGIGKLHGTWGSLAVEPKIDKFRIIQN